MLCTINDANLIHECLNSFLLDMPTAETLANPNYIFDTALSALKSIFMQLISPITNLILYCIVSFLFLLFLFGLLCCFILSIFLFILDSLFWAVLSIIALWFPMPSILLATHNHFGKPPNSDANTSE